MLYTGVLIPWVMDHYRSVATGQEVRQGSKLGTRLQLLPIACMNA